MSKITNRDTAPRDGGSVEHRLARLLDTPFLARVVPHLPPETLHQLIRYRGLDACGELVTVRARRTDAWDKIVTFLVTLETEHNHYFDAVMQGCRRLSNSRPEIDGLDNLLLAPEQHLHDVTIERERRRSQQGYATPADARAFLEMARQPKHTRSGASVTGSIKVTRPHTSRAVVSSRSSRTRSSRDAPSSRPRWSRDERGPPGTRRPRHHPSGRRGSPDD